MCLPRSHFPIISQDIEVGSGFHSENPRKRLERDARADLKIILRVLQHSESINYQDAEASKYLS